MVRAQSHRNFCHCAIACPSLRPPIADPLIKSRPSILFSDQRHALNRKCPPIATASLLVSLPINDPPIPSQPSIYFANRWPSHTLANPSDSFPAIDLVLRSTASAQSQRAQSQSSIASPFVPPPIETLRLDLDRPRVQIGQSKTAPPYSSPDILFSFLCRSPPLDSFIQ